MATFLIDSHSPIKSGITSKLRHRSRHSESENHNGNTPTNEVPAERKNFSGFYQETEINFQEKKAVKNKSMVSYFVKELTKDYKLERDASEFVERRDRVYTSVNTPINLEKFCAFGFLQCLDSILYMVTFLPLRIIVALFRVLTYPCAVVFLGRRRMLDGAQVCDILKGIILAASCIIISYMDMSLIYHEVRRQNIIKFYVLYNMLDVLDKLVSGFGQDVLDSLYWTAVEPRGRKREHFGTLFHLIFAIFYVVIHTFIILVQAVILNVAFNSKNNNLLTIIMSNNFIEIKGNLFKRLDKNHLCQITYSDVKERFHYIMMLLYVFIRNANDKEGSWEYAYPIVSNAVVVMFVEIIVDWVKHAFITKSNELSASLYADFALGLAQDIASSQKKHAFTNFSDQVCRRMGFTPIPLICVVFMVCSTSFNISGPLPWLLVFLFYLCLMSTKILISIILLGWAQRLITKGDKTTRSTGTVVNSQVIPKKEEKGPQAKAKPEAETEIPVSVCITTRPVAASSSIAVNTDSTFTMDTCSLNSLMQSKENTSISSYQNDNSITQADGECTDSKDDIMGNLKDQDLEIIASSERLVVSSDEELCLHQSSDLSKSVNSDSQEASSLYSISQSPYDLCFMHNDSLDQQTACDSEDSVHPVTVRPTLMELQTNLLMESQSLSNSITAAHTGPADKPERKLYHSDSV